MRKILVGVVLMTAAACGGSSSHGSTTATRADVTTFATIATDVSSAASSYGTAAQAATALAGCQAAERTYEDRVRPDVERMQQMSPMMDGTISGMGAHMAGRGDMGCASDAMHAELDRHAGAACASADMGANHAEAARHVQAMHDWAEHQVARCGELDDHMSGGGMMDGSTTAVCQRMPDGSYELGGMHP
jgi:hypothetical protein